MISELMSEGSKFLLAELKGSDLLFYLDPITDTTKDIIKKLNLSQENILLVHKIGFWSHAILILIFLNIIPHTKHFHIICAIPNVFLRDLKAKGRIKPIENIEEVEVYGISQVSHLSWKQILDLYTCTECGRCSDNCPAYLTNKPLSPKECILNLRDYIFRQAKEILKTKGACSFVPNVIKPAALWSCTTCRSCEEECPVFNTHIDKIIGIRQYLVLDQSEFPSELKLPFKALETNANPWDISQQDRDNWTKGLDIKLFSKGAKSEYLYFTGCAASFDDRNKKVAQSLAKLLLKAGVDFAILGSEEQCCGDTARRTGNEYLGQILIQTNIETFTKYNIKKIITSCPHCYNTLLNEYPDFNGGYEVWHHTQFLFELINTGRLKLQKRVQSRVLYHDPCYLARYNDIYDLPRKLLKEISGIKLVEPQRSKKRALCCGAGGGRMWMEEKIEERVNELRTEEILLQSPHIITSACPYCLTMLTDGLKAKDKDEDIQMLDVVELLSESVED
jgi:Fe-S oxidoreductase